MVGGLRPARKAQARGLASSSRCRSQDQPPRPLRVRLKSRKPRWLHEPNAPLSSRPGACHQLTIDAAYQRYQRPPPEPRNMNPRTQRTSAISSRIQRMCSDAERSPPPPSSNSRISKTMRATAISETSFQQGPSDPAGSLSKELAESRHYLLKTSRSPAAPPLSRPRS